MLKDFGIPENTVVLSELERRIFQIILENWPISALELAAHFRENTSSREEKKRASSRYCYYLKKLAQKKVVLGKRVGNSFVVWPLVVEKYRTIDYILRE